MACFLVPGSEGIVVTLLTKVMSKEKVKSLKLKWLSTMLWGGTILLIIEHIWHGEVVPWPPFLTAMSNPEDTAAMIHEIATHGVLMAAMVTFVWATMVKLSTVKAISRLPARR